MIQILFSIMESLTSVIEDALYRFKYLFYLVEPSKTMFEYVDQVPQYFNQAVPLIFILFLIEMIIRYYQRKPIINFNDTITSMTNAGLQACVSLSFRSFELIAYCVIYDNFCIVHLKWDSYSTWFICFIGVDLGYYVFHRCSHEINVLWAVHQVHHSFEDMNCLSSLRNSALKSFTQWFTYLPLALFIPPSIFFVHFQLNELFMAWIHTEVIHKLGPIEWILNTPSHHRVHHGRNRKYINKNYGGTLIIWDRLFGTFEAEDENEPAVYNLVHQVQNKLSVLFKGPGWAPGKPRLGNLNDVPLITFPHNCWSISTPIWWKICISFSFIRSFIFYYVYTKAQITSIIHLYSTLYAIFAITSLGFLLERRYFAPYLELFRSLLTAILFKPYFQYVLVQHSTLMAQIWHISYLTSVVLWLTIIIISNFDKLILYSRTKKYTSNRSLSRITY